MISLRRQCFFNCYLTQEYLLRWVAELARHFLKSPHRYRTVREVPLGGGHIPWIRVTEV